MFLVILSSAKSTGYLHEIWGGIELFLGGNRWMHFYMALVLSMLSSWSVVWSHPQLQRLLLFLLVSGCAVDEFLQYFLPLRNFNPMDFLATLAGLMLGWCVTYLFKTLKNECL